MSTATFKTEQERFWAGEFGVDYAARNQGTQWIASNTAFFAKVLARTNNVQSVLELGANIGLNLQAIRTLLPACSMSAVEINPHAVDVLRESCDQVQVFEQSILDFEPTEVYDFVFTKGVLIHLNPDALGQVYDRIFASSKRYIMVAEYYNPSPVAISYRGHEGKLFKRDFAGEMLDRFASLRLIDYGFSYHRDRNFPQDDLTWFLLEK